MGTDFNTDKKLFCPQISALYAKTERIKFYMRKSAKFANAFPFVFHLCPLWIKFPAAALALASRKVNSAPMLNLEPLNPAPPTDNAWPPTKPSRTGFDPSRGAGRARHRVIRSALAHMVQPRRKSAPAIFSESLATNKARAEMRERVNKTCAEAKNRMTKAIPDNLHVPIAWSHGFFAHIEKKARSQKKLRSSRRIGAIESRSKKILANIYCESVRPDDTPDTHLLRFMVRGSVLPGPPSSSTRDRLVFAGDVDASQERRRRIQKFSAMKTFAPWPTENVAKRYESALPRKCRGLRSILYYAQLRACSASIRRTRAGRAKIIVTSCGRYQDTNDAQFQLVHAAGLGSSELVRRRR